MASSQSVPVVQRIEHLVAVQAVGGSIPLGHAFFAEQKTENLEPRTENYKENYKNIFLLVLSPQFFVLSVRRRRTRRDRIVDECGGFENRYLTNVGSWVRIPLPPLYPALLDNLEPRTKD